MFNFQSENVKIACIAGICTVLGAGLSNIKDISDFLTNRKESGDINVELRHFIEVSGIRTSFEEMDKIKSEQYRLKYQIPEDTANCLLDFEVKGNEIIEMIVDVMKKHTTLEQVQEMNEFYSTPSMKSYLKEQPAITKDIMDGFDKLYERLNMRSGAILNGNDEICPDTNMENHQAKSKKRK